MVQSYVRTRCRRITVQHTQDWLLADDLGVTRGDGCFDALADLGGDR